MIETDYAKALYSLNPDKSHLASLRNLLKRRGHEKLLPRIFSEYKKLVLAEERRERGREITPEAERTRILLELYRKLIHTN
jgi:hypothetical protein